MNITDKRKLLLPGNFLAVEYPKYYEVYYLFHDRRENKNLYIPIDLVTSIKEILEMEKPDYKKFSQRDFDRALSVETLEPVKKEMYL